MIPNETADKLKKLISLLSSDQDGEVLGAARAIGRTPAAAGLDFHALAACVGPRTLGAGWSGPAFATPGFNYADAFRQARPPYGPDEHPDARTRSFGLPIYTDERVESWMEVGRHCLDLNRSIPKKHGGRFLREFEIKLVRDFADGRLYPTNAPASWMESVVARCHQARAAWRRAKAAETGGAS
ncbi:hypothetical protein HNR00_005091 [Methylorubrum rhodinum]|uniref:Uncharacterized protein n=1 Tax=Methylorubrum rhodinum TaxID=29428 RepID=A0A840ZPY8_9HYPH|nr:hypothetical protein [Methylorubrum rhodinum]MBB5760342.1 hypothetical protein [Methylorubrum rhodinum]